MRWNIRAPHLLSASFLALVLTACGGGGSDSSSSSGNNSNGGNSGGGQPSGVTDNNAPPTVSAGEDQTVDEQSGVRLTATFSDSDGDLAGIDWQQLSGPMVVLPVVNISGGATLGGNSVSLITNFTAPVVTGSGNSVELVFQLTMTDDGGAKATDEVTITVNAVNAEPEVSLVPSQRAIAEETVTLMSNSIDRDGSIDNYLWEQTSGTEVTLSSTNEPVVSFTAPVTDTVDTLEFSVTVTDNEGAVVRKEVSVEVASVNMPEIAMTFPPATGVYTSMDIDAFGVAEAKNGATITSVVVTTDAGTVDATVNDDGSWRANDIVVPSDVDAFTLTAEITDSEGRVRQAVSNLTKSAEVGSGIEIKNDVTGVLFDDDTVYVMTAGILESGATPTLDNHFLAIDLATGKRTSITDNLNGEQGVIIGLPSGAVLDKANDRIIVTDPLLGGKLIAITLSDGQRSVVSDAETGSGELFDRMQDLSFNADRGLAYLVDNRAGRIFSVDTMSGDRTVIADATTANVAVEFPLSLAFDSTNNRIIYHPNITGLGPIISLDLSVSPATSSVISTNDDNDGPALGQGVFALTLNGDGSIAYAISEEGNIQSIDLNTGTRALVSATGFTGDDNDQKADLAYDSTNNLIYTAGTTDSTIANALYVVDPQTGDRVKLSQ